LHRGKWNEARQQLHECSCTSENAGGPGDLPGRTSKETQLMKDGRPQGYIAFTLHAHLPWVIHHGTWPHGLEWLLEAAVETYLPLLRALRNLERAGLALKANINLSPVLLEQLAHPAFKAEFPDYLKRKIQSTQEDESYFRQSGDEHYAKTARYWREFFEQAQEDFAALGGDIIRGFRHFNDAGLIEIVTCSATHGYLPLLGTDESMTAQVKTGAAAHERHMGRKPRGIWSPECGYRPAGKWQAPVAAHGSTEAGAAFERMGVEQALAEAGIEYFLVDSHLLEQHDRASLYRAYWVDGPRAREHPVAMFPRDPLAGLQVWRGDTGYPGDPHYLDFHKKRWPGGHRYWQVTHSRASASEKTPYCPDRAAERVRAHAEHFVRVVYQALMDNLDAERPPILSAPFDADLFGHWWFEGPAWLEQVARIIANEEFPIALTTGSEYLERYGTEGFLSIPEGSWGKNGSNEVWLNPQTSWTWSHIYKAEAKVRAVATEGKWRDSALGQRIAKQMCRELLLLESSDWQFLITTEAARDYAEHRFQTHMDQFRIVELAWGEFLEKGSLTPVTEKKLAVIEERDNLFAEIDPALWAQRAS
jgi:1,4-alpha-glucan branching enzyme